MPLGSRSADDVDVVVVGGGISGLSAARDLCLAGHRVRLLEQSGRCGGVIVTDRTDGFVIDAGPDTLLGHKPAALALCRELGLESCLTSPLVPRTTYVVRDGALRALPDTSAFGFPTDWTSLLTTRAFSLAGKLRMALEPWVRATPRPDESIASFIGRRFGTEAVIYLAEPLLAGLHKGDATRLSMRALFPSFVDAEHTHGSVVRSWRHRTARQTGTGSMSLTGGLQTLVDAVHDALPRDVVWRGATVQSVERGCPWGYVTRLMDGRTIRARAVMLAVPPAVVSRLVSGVHAELSTLCGGIRSESSVTVALAYPRAAVGTALRGWGVVVPPHAGLRTSAVGWVSSKWPGRVPSDAVLFRVSLGGHHHPRAVREADDTLVWQAHEDLRTLLKVTGAPTLSRVYRWPHTIPQFDVGHLERMAGIERCLTGTRGLFLSASGFRGTGLPDCIADARRTAGQVTHMLEAEVTAHG